MISLIWVFRGWRADLCAFADWNRIIVGTLQDKNDADEEDPLSSRRDSDDMVQEWRWRRPWWQSDFLSQFLHAADCDSRWLWDVCFSTLQAVVLLPYYLNYSVFYGFKKNPQSIVQTEQFGRCLQQWWLLWYRLNVLLICYGLLPLILGVLISHPRNMNIAYAPFSSWCSTSTFLLSQLPSEHTCTSFSYLRLSFVSIFIVFPLYCRQLCSWCLRYFFPLLLKN